jgi:hypothetical protein
MADQQAGSSSASAPRKTAGALDIRNIIGLLLGIYGLVLIVMGFVADQELAKTGGVNANLYAGIGLVVVAAVFLTWARLRPIVVPVHVAGEHGPNVDGTLGAPGTAAAPEPGRPRGH